MADDQAKFWSNPANWPGDTSECVFLCRATLLVGKALFGEDWTGNEPTTPSPYDFWLRVGARVSPLPQSQATQHQKLQMHRVISEHCPQFKLDPVRSGSWGPQPIKFSDEEWSAGQKAANAIDAGNAAALQRFAEAKLFLVSALLDGRVIARLRPIRGGAFGNPIPAHDWNGENIWSRFCWGQMNPHDPFGGGVGGDAYQYVYVERRSLEALLNSAGGSEEETTTVPSGIPSEHFDGIAIGRDPMGLPVWSFGMAVAWIMCRSSQAATEYWNGPLDVALVYTAPGAMIFEAAQAELVQRLALGSLTATATDEQGDIQELGAHEWRHLTPQPAGGNNGLKIRLWRPGGGIGGTAYHDVRLLRDDVLAVWPETRNDEAATLVQPPAKSIATAYEVKQRDDSAPASRPAATATIKKAITSCATFAARRGIALMNRGELADILGDIFKGTPRQKIREAFNEPEIVPLLPERQGPRGPRNPNRNNEIEEFRRFLSAAELRN